MHTVFFDVDGTLIDHNQRLPVSVVETVRRLHRKGNLAILNTGRPLSTIPRGVLALGFDGIIAACGTSVHIGDKTLLEATVPPDLLAELLRLFEEYRFRVILEGPTHIYVDDITDAIYAKEIGQYHTWGMDVFRNWNSPDILVNKLTYLTRGAGHFAPVEQKLSEQFIPIVYEDWIGDWVRKGYSKASGMELILNEIGCPIEHTFAFGDSENDLEMLCYAGCGVAMGNSPQLVKQASDYVTDDIHADGLIKGLAHFNLI